VSPVVEAHRYATKAVFVVLAVVSRTPRGTRRWTRLVPAGGGVAASVRAQATSPPAAATAAASNRSSKAVLHGRAGVRAWARPRARPN
jgi:hypothetical protein